MLDHLIVAARTVEEGAAWVASRLGAEPGPGGKHPQMGTHNRLLSLGPEAYLEVIAIDPEAGPPPRPRWMGLDCGATKALLARGPALIHWVERCADLTKAIAQAGDELDIHEFHRGAFRWRIALTRDGSLPGGGRRPTLIQWQSAHPAASLPDSGRRLLTLGAPDGEARFSTPAGVRTMPWTLAPGRE